MNKINVNNLFVFDNDNGKPPLIFVHAFPLNSNMWQNQIDFFSDKFRVIYYDVRGLGINAQSNNQFMMEDYTDDLISIIDFLNLTDVNAVGLSMGGYIIQGALVREPSKFKSIILADTKGEKDNDDALIGRANSIKLIKNNQRNIFLANFIKNLIAENNYSKFVHNLNDIISLNSDEGIIGAMLALATRTNTIDSLVNLKHPALILVGENDKLTPLSSAENLSKSLSNSILKIVPNAGHLSNIENPDFFNSEILNFLNNTLK